MTQKYVRKETIISEGARNQKESTPPTKQRQHLNGVGLSPSPLITISEGAYGKKNPKQRWSFSRMSRIPYFRSALTVVISVIMITSIAKAGSLTPPGVPGSTMSSLADIAGSAFNTTTHSLTALYGWLVSNVGGTKDTLSGTYDASGVSASASGNVMQQLKFIQQNLGGYAFGSANAEEVLTIAGGTYNAANLTPANVKSGVAYGVDKTGTYGGGGWTYGSDDITKVLTTADTPGTYDASNLSVGTVKNGTAFGIGLTGDYPSATNPLSGDTGATDATASTICNGNEAWTKTGSLLTGTLSVNAAHIAAGNTYCGTLGTLLANLFNGTGSENTGGSQANGGVDDYNNAGAAPLNRYTGSWTACTSGNNYCGTGDSAADVKDGSTGLIWSKLCSGSGCSSFSDTLTNSYSWNSTGANNNSRTAPQLCSDHAGWYLPHQKQLMQAYVDGSYGNFGPSSTGYVHWSATIYSYDAAKAWSVHSSTGKTDSTDKVNTLAVRCVR